jgi:hypothetical protein
MTRTPRTWLRAARLALVASLALLATGCSNGQLVDAGGDRGQGGLAFILLTVFFWLFFGALFYMDRQRKKREAAASSEEE